MNHTSGEKSSILGWVGVALVLAVVACVATIPRLYDCEACNGTGWNQGLRSSDYTGSDECYFCDGTLSITFWSRHFGDHATFMSHFD